MVDLKEILSNFSSKSRSEWLEGFTNMFNEKAESWGFGGGLIGFIKKILGFAPDALNAMEAVESMNPMAGAQDNATAVDHTSDAEDLAIAKLKQLRGYFNKFSNSEYYKNFVAFTDKIESELESGTLNLDDNIHDIMRGAADDHIKSVVASFTNSAEDVSIKDVLASELSQSFNIISDTDNGYKIQLNNALKLFETGESVKHLTLADKAAAHVSEP